MTVVVDSCQRCMIIRFAWHERIVREDLDGLFEMHDKCLDHWHCFTMCMSIQMTF